MKKALMIALMSLVPAVSLAKITDFNAMINENSKAQRELHKEVRNSAEETRAALHDERKEPIVVVETERIDVNVPSGKNLLRFQKEIVDHKDEKKAGENRLANEFNSVDLEF